jgi:hypothetical protein
MVSALNDLKMCVFVCVLVHLGRFADMDLRQGSKCHRSLDLVCPNRRRAPAYSLLSKAHFINRPNVACNGYTRYKLT